MVLLYFLWVRRHKYAAVAVVLSRMYSSTYGLTLMHLSYMVNLSGIMIWHCTHTYSTKDTHYEMNELKLLNNMLSGGGNTYSVSPGKVTARNLSVWSTWELKTD